MKLEAGKYYKSRDGGKWWSVGRMETDIHFCWLLECCKTHILRHFASNGKYIVETEHPFEIISEWTEPKSGTFWVNVYPGKGRGCAHDSREGADEWAESSRLACIEVKWTEGEGL